MSSEKKTSHKWLVVKRNGNNPIQLVAGERLGTEKKAEKETREWNRAYKGNKKTIVLI